MTQADRVYAWSEIADDFRGTLLVGNGGSIDLSEKFYYSNLYLAGIEQGKLSSHIQELFQKFSEKRDFEKVLRRLWAADFINKKFEVAKVEQEKIRKPYTDVRRALIDTVKNIHPDQESLASKLDNIGQFCLRFSKVFTLNYDLTLTWAIEASNKMAVTPKKFSDGFSSKKTSANLSTFIYSGHNDHGDIGVYYLHGNLCLYQTKIKMDEKKLASENKDSSLLKQLTEYWANNDVQPLFVCEGSSYEKSSAIAQSSYLSAAYESLKSDRGDSLVIYGWSISKGDQHILDAIKHSTSYKRAAVSVHNNDHKYLAHAKQALSKIGIESVRFFDSGSQGCWTNRSLP